MRETLRPQIQASYSLHDMSVSAFEITGNELILRTQSGMMKTSNPCRQVDGYVKFQEVQWDFSYAYLLDFPGNTGPFSGEKLFLRDFTERHPRPFLTVMDESYGYNATRYTGFLTQEGRFMECILEICHEGDMVFVEETAYHGMAEVVLSHDSGAMVCLVPAGVAGNLEEYCLDFAANWVWHGPENGKYLRPFGENQIGAVFGAPDFIEYLNKWCFPDQPSRILIDLNCGVDGIPAEYRTLPRFNF